MTNDYFIARYHKTYITSNLNKNENTKQKNITRQQHWNSLS